MHRRVVRTGVAIAVGGGILVLLGLGIVLMGGMASQSVGSFAGQAAFGVSLAGVGGFLLKLGIGLGLVGNADNIAGLVGDLRKGPSCPCCQHRSPRNAIYCSQCGSPLTEAESHRISPIPNLHFAGECKDALTLYQEAFGAQVSLVHPYHEADPQCKPQTAEYVYHAEMAIGSHRFFLSDSDQRVLPGESSSVLMEFDALEDLKQAYDSLSQEGKIIYPIQETSFSSGFASIVDRFGKRWELMVKEKDSLE